MLNREAIDHDKRITGGIISVLVNGFVSIPSSIGLGYTISYIASCMSAPANTCPAFCSVTTGIGTGVGAVVGCGIFAVTVCYVCGCPKPSCSCCKNKNTSEETQSLLSKESPMQHTGMRNK